MEHCALKRIRKSVPLEEDAVFEHNYWKQKNEPWCGNIIHSSIGSLKIDVFQGFFILSEQDDPSGQNDFPWMQLHCNFQGLVAESNSDREILAMSVAE